MWTTRRKRAPQWRRFAGVSASKTYDAEPEQARAKHVPSGPAGSKQRVQYARTQRTPGRCLELQDPPRAREYGPGSHWTHRPARACAWHFRRARLQKCGARRNMVTREALRARRPQFRYRTARVETQPCVVNRTAQPTERASFARPPIGEH